MWRATTKGTQSRWQRTVLHAWTSCVTQFCWFRVNQLFSHFAHSFTSTELLGADFHQKWLKSVIFHLAVDMKTRRIQALWRMKPLRQGLCVTYQWKPRLPTDSLLAFEWTFFVPESRKLPPKFGKQAIISDQSEQRIQNDLSYTFCSCCWLAECWWGESTLQLLVGIATLMQARISSKENDYFNF